MKMVKQERDVMFPIVFRLIKLALILPVATTFVERAFSTMNIFKTDLGNRMNDERLSSLLLCYIEKEILRGIDVDEIKRHFNISRIDI
jgi:hypothetical protein